MKSIPTELVRYEKIISLNSSGFDLNSVLINECVFLLLGYVHDKCKKDNETLQYFQMNLTDSEKNPFGLELKIKWAVTKK